MKKAIIFLLLIGFYSLSGNAQRVSDVRNKHIESSGTHFEQPVKDAKWGNTNGKSYTKATYKSYTGETFVKMKATENVGALLKFDIKVEKGELELEFVDLENEVIFKKVFTKSETGETKITLEGNKDYRIRFIGKDTKGSYFCQWIEQ